MGKYDELKNRILLLDGAMGTMIQAAGLNEKGPAEALPAIEPFELTRIHRKYVDAGADIVYACTFGANRYKLAGTGYEVERVVHEAVQSAKLACDEDTLVAASIGPIGQLLEPMGELTFEDAYDTFREIVVQAEKSGADIIVFETMTDIYEVKAGVLAVRENTSLPVFVSMTFEENGRTFTGCSIENMVVTLEGMGVEALGINCSLGPIEIFPLARELCRQTSLPVFIKPNAGLPDPATGAYDISPEQFVETMESYINLGVNMVGGCCGTTPEYIEKLNKMLQGKQPLEKLTRSKSSRVCSGTRVVEIDHTTVIGERLNPTGKPQLKEALQNGDIDYIVAQAMAQVKDGAEILDVNVGTPGVDEVSVLPAIIKKIQSVTDVPLQIDSSNPTAIEAALRVYNGKPIVNSVSGEAEKLKTIMPIVAHYGAAVVGLTLDENGIPDTAEERADIAARIVAAGREAGVIRSNIFIDCLTLTVSAEQKLAMETLKAVSLVKSELGVKTVLGVSNISFGLPERPLINRTFLASALQAGLDLPIINPGDGGMMDTIAAFELLSARDENAASFIEKFSGRESLADASKQASEPESTVSRVTTAKPIAAGNALVEAMVSGLGKTVGEIVEQLLVESSAIDVINEFMVPALDVIGKAFEAGEIFLPQMMQAATAAQTGFDIINQKMAREGIAAEPKGPIVMATVEGDIHDIGKNIVETIMENYGYQIIDLGKDVPVERVVSEVEACGAKLVGLSALMTTTLPAMEKTIEALKACDPEIKVMVGGAVLTESYAKKIGADYYCADAMKSVEAARKVLG